MIHISINSCLNFTQPITRLVSFNYCRNNVVGLYDYRLSPWKSIRITFKKMFEIFKGLNRSRENYTMFGNIAKFYFFELLSYADASIDWTMIRYIPWCIQTSYSFLCTWIRHELIKMWTKEIFIGNSRGIMIRFSNAKI